MTRVVRLPPRFYEDHVSRAASDLDTFGVVVKETKKYVDVELSDGEFEALLDDARFYADGADSGFEDAGLFGLISSAKATVRRLEAATSSTADTTNNTTGSENRMASPKKATASKSAATKKTTKANVVATKKATATVDRKVCPICEKTKTFAEFGVRGNGKPLSYCKPCRKTYLVERKAERSAAAAKAERAAKASTKKAAAK